MTLQIVFQDPISPRVDGKSNQQNRKSHLKPHFLPQPHFATPNLFLSKPKAGNNGFLSNISCRSTGHRKGSWWKLPCRSQAPSQTISPELQTKKLQVPKTSLFLFFYFFFIYKIVEGFLFFLFLLLSVSGLVLLLLSMVTKVFTLIWRTWATLLDSGICMDLMLLHHTILFRFLTHCIALMNSNHFHCVWK